MTYYRVLSRRYCPYSAGGITGTENIMTLPKARGDSLIISTGVAFYLEKKIILRNMVLNLDQIINLRLLV